MVVLQIRYILGQLVFVCIFILSIACLFIIANTLLASYLSVTVLFLLDVAVWTAMHFYITAKITKKHPRN